MHGFVLVIAAAWGGETATLRDGPTVLDPCLADPACGAAARVAIADALRDAGFAAEPLGIGTHAALAGTTGAVLEIGAQSFVLPPGGTGLQPSGVGIAPVVPRLGVGFVAGDDGSDVRGALAFHGAPPIPVAGDVAWSGSLQASLAWGEPSGALWAGLEVDLGVAGATGGLLDENTLSSLDPAVAAPPCGPRCVDRFSQLHGGLGSTLRVDVDPSAPLFLGFGGVVSRQSLTSAADGSTWEWAGLQPRARLGVGYRPAPAGLLALAVVGGLRERPTCPG